MRKISFVGTIDKVELILNIAKVARVLKKNVLVIDSTFEQRTRYWVPSIKPMLKYITTYEDIDIAVGFQNMEEIYEEVGQKGNEFPYDLILIDIDIQSKMQTFGAYDSDKIYFATGFDNYTLKRGLETFTGNQGEVSVEKIIIAREFTRLEDEHLNLLAQKYNIFWEKDIRFFPSENGDSKIISSNNRDSVIKIRAYSLEYREHLREIALKVLSDLEEVMVDRAFKHLDKVQ